MTSSIKWSMSARHSSGQALYDWEAEKAKYRSQKAKLESDKAKMESKLRQQEIEVRRAVLHPCLLTRC